MKQYDLPGVMLWIIKQQSFNGRYSNKDSVWHNWDL